MPNRDAHDAAHEHEAERTAARATPGAHHCGCTCGACAHRLHTGPQPLPDSLRASYGQALGANLDAVRVHEDAAASQVRAAAFTSGDTITFAPGRYRPDTPAGRHLLTHELTHTLQQRSNPPAGLSPATRGRIQRNEETPLDVTALTVAAVRIAGAIAINDVDGAVAPLRDRSLEERIVIRERVIEMASVKLEHWFAERTRASPPTGAIGFAFSIAGSGLASSAISRLPPPTARAAEEGLRRIWRAAPLIDRLEVYDEGSREIEQAQLDVIRAASRDERIMAQAPANRERLDRVLGKLDAREEYDARKLLDVNRQRRLETATRMLDRSDDDVLFDAILDLEPWTRVKFVIKDHERTLYRRLYGWQFNILKNMARGTEPEALIQRLRLATQGRRDDQEAVSSVMDRAVELLKERRELQAIVGSLSGEARTETERRLTELETLDRLLRFERTSGGGLREQTFLGLVSGARDNPAAFAADAARLAEFAADPQAARRHAFEVAKQRILLADGDTDAMRIAILQTHAPRRQTEPGAPAPSASDQQADDEQLRREVLTDPAVVRVVGRIANTIPRNQVIRAIEGDRFNELLIQFSGAVEGGRYGEVFHVAFLVAKNPGWRARLKGSATEGGLHAALNAINHLPGQPRRIVDWILDHPAHLPLVDILDFLSNEDQLKVVLDDIGEADRAKLRLGWHLTEHPRIGPPTETEAAAIQLYTDVKSHLKSSQTGLISFDASGYQSVMATALGSEPTADEQGTGAGRYRAALIWYDQQQQRLALDRGMSADFTETDETMVAAAREYAAIWVHLRDQNTVSMIDFYALANLQRTFEGRSKEFTEASNSIGELAAMIAATVAGIIVVVATGGAATPGVIALAAAAGGSARVVTREMFGGDYYDALSSDSARDFLLGSVDGALSVVGAGLAARGTQLLGLSGGALTKQAGRLAGEVAEEAARPLGRRVLGSSVESAIDGAFSGTVSEAFGAMADERTWRRGIMDGLSRVGAAALLGGLTGAVGGGVMGGVMPVVGHAGSRLWSAVAKRGVESTIERAGMSEALLLARRAARAGNTDEVNRLAAELERDLAADEIVWLRQHLGDELREKLGRPPGTVLPDPKSDAARLLGETSTQRVPTDAHLKAELDVVRASQPQPSREPGFLDEVDLGNGHTWRRKRDGKWCRFSDKTLCDTDILNAPPLSEKAQRQARIEAATDVLQQERMRLAEVGDQHRQYNELVDRLAARQTAGERIDFTALTAAEQQIINNVERVDFANTSLKELQGLRQARMETPAGGRPRRVPSELEEQTRLALSNLKKAEDALADVRQSFYDKLRKASPGKSVRDDVMRGKTKDFVSSATPFSGALECDHIVPLREIADMPGFKRLDWAEQVKVANYVDNLKPVDALVNAHRQNRSWRGQFEYRNKYTDKQLEAVIKHEDDMRIALQGEIDKLLIAAGKPTGPP